jgi:hypothetical protein
MKDTLKIQGRIRLDIIRNGKLIKGKWIKNVITNIGKASVAGLVGNTGTITAFTYLAVGTSNTATNASQTALIAEITDTNLARVAATVSRTTTTTTNDTLQFVYTWTSSGTKAVEEIGVFNDPTTGTMLCRALTSTKSLTNGDQLLATYQIKFS